MRQIIRLIAIACLFLTMLAGQSFAGERIAFGTTNTRSSHYSFAVSLARSVAAANTGLEVTVSETGGSVDNIKRMSRGLFDMGITTTEVLFQAYNGIGLFKGKKNNNLRILMLYTGVPMVLVVREDSGVTSIRDLSGKRFNPGMRGSSSEKTTERVFNVLGIKPNYYRGSVGDALQAVKNRQIVGLTKAGAGFLPDAALMELQTLSKIRLLGFSESDVKQVLVKYPYYSAVKIPANTYNGQDKPVRTFGFVMALAVQNSLSEDAGYKLVKAFVTKKKIQEDAFAAVKGVDYVNFTIDQASIPLHAGAARFYREMGKIIPANLVAN